MNDVKVIGVDGLNKQSAVTSSSQNLRSAEGASELDDKLRLKEVEKEAEKEKVEVTPQQIEDAVTKLNDYVQTVQRDLQFNLDDNSGKTIITVVDSHTSEVIRQIPDDVALKLAQDLQQNEPLSLFNAKV